MGHDTTIPRFIVIFWKFQNRADKQVAVYCLCSLTASHYIDYSADKLSQNNLIQNFLSSLFRYWQINKDDVAAIKSEF